jgi:tetratricopeptide (TPR) repeat protein
MAMNIKLMGRYGLLVLCFLLVTAPGSMQAGVVFDSESALAGKPEKTDSEAQRKLTVASMQHELILLLIESRSYDRVQPEWKKVLDLKLGARYEGAIAESLLTIGYKLLEAKQVPLAQQILDDSLSTMPFSNKNKADILRFKAYLFKESGDLENAIRTLRLATDLAK